MTPPEISRVSNGDGWGFRIIPNLFPVLDGSADSAVAGARSAPDGPEEISGFISDHC